MMFSRVIVTLLALRLARAQDCVNEDNGQCDFEPFNPVVCGPDKNCGYDNFCLAIAAGYDIEADCCQAPQPSACVQIFEPQVCGSKSCPYDNLCLAELAGYSADQCTPAPEECSTGEGCTGEPSNPVKCGAGFECRYENFCLATSAGFDTSTQCCQDVRGNTACAAIFAPVSCGPPAGKQCPYSNQCEADAAGYNSNQCCAAVPEDAVCTSEVTPAVECGTIPCLYVSQCEASAAGYAPEDCCPQAEGACTADNDPVACGTNKCFYSSQSCADLAGWTSGECCKQPKEVAACPAVLDPVACSTANCVYDNDCIAELAGFDPNSCVRLGGTAQNTGDNSTTTSGAKHVTMVGSAVATLALLMTA